MALEGYSFNESNLLVFQIGKPRSERARESSKVSQKVRCSQSLQWGTLRMNTPTFGRWRTHLGLQTLVGRVRLRMLRKKPQD